MHLRKPDTSTVAVVNLVFGSDLLEFETELDARSQWQSVEARAWDYSQQALFTVESSSSASFQEHGNLSGAYHVYVNDCDAAYRRALEAGAVTLMGERGEPADRPYGERSAFVEDPFGNYWYIATRLPSAAAPRSRWVRAPFDALSVAAWGVVR